MYVISLICQGDLRKTALKGNAKDAVKLAEKWFEANKESCLNTGYIAIDQKVKGNVDMVRFAELHFNEVNKNANITLISNNPAIPFSSNFLFIAKQVLGSILEIAIIKAGDYLKNKQK